MRVEIPSKARQDLDHGLPALAAGDLLKVAVEGVELTVEPVEVDQHLRERGLGERVIEPLTGDPRPVHLRPLAATVPVDAPVAQELLAHPVTRAGARAAQVLAAAHEIPEPLGLRRRRLLRRRAARRGRAARASSRRAGLS